MEKTDYLLLSLTFLTLFGCQSKAPAKATNSTAVNNVNNLSQLSMRPMHVQFFGENGMEWELNAPEAHGLAQAAVLSANQIDITLYQSGQKSTNITADEGFINTSQDNWRGAGLPILKPGDMYLTGHVVVVSTDSSRLTTDWVNYKKTEQVIVSTAPVEILKENTVTKGRGLEASPDLRSVKIFEETLVIKEDAKNQDANHSGK